MSLNLLKKIERAGNKIPDPVVLFLGLTVGLGILTWVLATLGVSAIHPATGASIPIISLLQKVGLQEFLLKAVENFATFPPLGAVLVTMIGVGIAEQSGWITAALRSFVQAMPKALLSIAVVTAGVMSSLAADAGYVVLVPLGALVFLAAGRAPLAGLGLAFAGVAGGFSANLFVTSLDPLLSSLTESAAKIVDPNATASIGNNYYFMAASVFFLGIIGTGVNRFFIEPKQKHLRQEKESVEALSVREKKALKVSNLWLLACVAIMGLLTIPSFGLLRGENGSLDPFYKSLVVLIAIIFAVVGIAYGKKVGSIKTHRDVVSMANTTMGSLGPYIVLSFFMAQFLYLFKVSNVGLVMAVEGANLLKAMGLQGPLLLVFFILLSSTLNLFIGSASAKWALLAPVFVPMLMLVGIDPATTQAAYRVADSSTNVISPLLPYMPLILVVMQKYDPKAGLGTLLALMLPYALCFLVAWTSFLLLWVWLGIPLGF